jgi:Transposase DDE domain group 1
MSPNLPEWKSLNACVISALLFITNGPPGAQLRFTDIGGHRFTCFATNARHGQLADLELRHRRRARCEDRIRCAKDTGLRNLPLHGYAQNQIWCEIVALACDLLAWTQTLALDGPARRWEPKRLRLRIFTCAGASSAAAAASSSASQPMAVDEGRCPGENAGPAGSHRPQTRQA